MGDQAADRDPGEVVEQRQHGLEDGAADGLEIDVDALGAGLLELFGEIRREIDDGEIRIVRDSHKASTWIRWLARYLLRREAAVLAALAGCQGVPELLEVRRDLLAELIERCFDRACFAVTEIASVPEQQQSEVVEALKSLAEIVLSGKNASLDQDLFAQHVESAAIQSTVPFLRGVFLGLLTELRYMTPEALAGHVANYASSPPEKIIEA